MQRKPILEDFKYILTRDVRALGHRIELRRVNSAHRVYSVRLL